MNESPYREFRVALNYLIDKGWKGKQKSLIDQAGISFGYLSQLKKGERVSSTRVQYSLAKALGTTFEQMISLGEQLIEQNEPEDSKDHEKASEKSVCF